MSGDMRIEHDSMGEVEVPAEALWRAQTQRAVQNFPISGRPLPPDLIHALARIKGAAARANADLDVISPQQRDAIVAAVADIVAGQHDDQFPIDVFQTGSGTSTNMNVNEVISSLTARAGVECHPNDVVNASQSSNDTFPSAMHVAVVLGSTDLQDATAVLHDALTRKSQEYADAVKSGRTHLMDATPVTLGQELGGYAATVAGARDRLATAVRPVRELALGGTAVGTGINTPPAFAETAIGYLNNDTGEEFVEAPDHFEAQGTQDSLVAYSGALRTYAVGLVKICNDLRWMGSGPTAGLAEIHLQDLQPGSSIMPGKVNPVIPEATLQVCAQVIGNDAAVTFAGASGSFELNVMLPVIARNVLESMELLANASRLLATCVDGITANRDRMRAYAESSPSIVTPLNKYIGYEAAAKVAKRALAEGATIRQTVIDLGYVERGEITEEQLDEALDVERMTRP
ncbi:MAG TPA: class II fumarate hydratase [Nocardioides sp.]|nr:class II fumarate hydratase [Nocardioides sp.]